MVGYICQRCGQDFERPNPSKPPKYCGHACANNRAFSKVDIAVLKRLAREGCRNDHMAQQLGVSTRTARRALFTNGLYQTWAKARYLKCGAGTKSASAVGGVVISPLSVTTPVAAGDSSCGT